VNVVIEGNKKAKRVGDLKARPINVVRDNLRVEQAQLPGLGTEFSESNVDIFNGCNCKRVALGTMNRWDVLVVTAKQITDLAVDLNAKNRKVTVAELEKRLTTFIETRRLEQAAIDSLNTSVNVGAG